tara:strand:+ start:17857 stop:19047 length:1191 start_codon:yes stop_codon:yes gene_type:complete
LKKNVVIVGGGLIGLALAYKYLLSYKKHKVILIEKEADLGFHQSGRNSGVLHCGLSYKPNTLKARLSVDGIKQMIDFCKVNEVNHDVCGKIVVANTDNEIKILENLAKRGFDNGLKKLKFLNNRELLNREPYVRSKKTLLVPDEGIVDFIAVQKELAKKIVSMGGKIILSEEVLGVSKNNNNELITNKNIYGFDLLFNCAGLFTDRIFKKLSKTKPSLKIIPFRGEYFKLKEEYKKYINHLVYPVPNPKFPFLGVHFTRMINGDRELGPNAVLATKREGYSNKDFSFYDFYDSVTYQGLIKFIIKNFNFSLNEFKSSLFKGVFIKRAQEMIPEINTEMFLKGKAGIRAQAVEKKGSLLMDFKIISHDNQIHVLNAPSPGATACLSIADYIINYIKK